MIHKLYEKIGGNWLFLLGMVAIYAGVSAFDLELTISAFEYLGDLFIKILPVLALVFVLIFVSNLLIDKKQIVKHLGHESGLKGWVTAIAMGIISSGPVYMWYPLLADLKDKGMKPSLIAAFIYSRAIKIPLIPMMVYYFSWEFAIVLTIYMILGSVLVGLFTSKLLKP